MKDETLVPPPARLDPMTPQDRYIAQCTSIWRTVGSVNPYEGLNASEKLAKMLELADAESPTRGNFLLAR